MDGGAGGGGTLSEVYQSAKRLLLRTRDALERLERLECSATAAAAAAAAGGLDSPQLSASIRRDVVQIQSLCIEMDRLWRFLGAKSQRDLWRRKVEQVAEEAESLKVSLDKYSSRNQQKMMEAKERAELLGRANGDSAQVLSIFDEEAQAMQSARNSSRMLEESYATGVAILSKYSEQRERLKMYSSEILLDFLRWHTEHLATDETMKNLMIRETQSYMTKKAQRRALDILNTVGLSNSVLKLIERRHHVDKWIKYAGMILTLIILYAFWRWTR